MRLPHKTLEKKLFQSGYRYICAVDEVGMGCLAGPVVVCAVLFKKEFFRKKHKSLYWLRDSKMLLPHQREKFLGELLKVESLKFQVGFCYPKTIDRINIYQAARLAMRRAAKRVFKSLNVSRFKGLKVSKFSAKDGSASGGKNSIVLVDGKTEIKNLEMPQMAIVKGDRKVFAIACASIIAKVYRDRMMRNYSKKFPQYGFEKHKGYSTKFHKITLAKFGISPIHRKSFAPVARCVKMD